jgi:hypothetical protein
MAVGVVLLGLFDGEPGVEEGEALFCSTCGQADSGRAPVITATMILAPTIISATPNSTNSSSQIIRRSAAV